MDWAYLLIFIIIDEEPINLDHKIKSINFNRFLSFVKDRNAYVRIVNFRRICSFPGNDSGRVLPPQPRNHLTSPESSGGVS